MHSKHYKQNKYKSIMVKRGRNGQVTVFIILALAIVAVALLLYIYLKPSGLTLTQDAVSNPQTYLKSCVQDDLRSTLLVIGEQGGYVSPEGYILYQDKKIKYLCYTSEYYKNCIVQQPLIKEHVEEELKNALKERINSCVESLADEYRKRGYSVSSTEVSHIVSIEPHNIIFKVNSPMTVSKDVARTFRGFDIEIPSEFYDLLITSTSIIDFESKLGDSETLTYSQVYPDLVVRKTKLSDGSKIYEVENVESEESFTFASRSLSWPPGYSV